MYNALFVVVSCFSLMSLCSCRRRIVGFVYQQASSSRLSTWHCPHLLLSAVLRRRCCCAPASAAVGRYLLPHGAQQQTRRTPLMERWDRQTDKPTPDRYIPLRYLSDITVANIAGSFTDKMAAKTSWHRYESNLVIVTVCTGLHVWNVVVQTVIHCPHTIRAVSINVAFSHRDAVWYT